LKIDILSLFPKYFESPLEESIIKRARDAGILDVHCHNIRDHAKGPHAKVDDRPFGGGPGMVLMAEPVASSIRSLKRENSCVIYLSPQGTPLNAALCRSSANLEHIILLCGHYEGIDERVLESLVDMEISIGDFVLTSGCPAALVFIDAISRFVPGVLGHEDAAEDESFENDLLEYPHYTRPRIFEGKAVPSILLEGNHGEIAKWRHAKALERTQSRRPDLIDPIPQEKTS